MRRSWATPWLWCALALWALGCRATVLEGLEEAEANDLVTALDGAGFAADKTSRAGRYAVEVDQGAFADAWSAARAHGFPRPAAAPPPSGLVSTAAEREAAQRHARQAAIADVLRADPAVSSARVALGPRGAAVAIETPTPDALDRAALDAQVRVAAGLAPDAIVALAVHPIARVDRGPTPERPAWPLWLASAAVIAMGGAAGLLWWSSRG